MWGGIRGAPTQMRSRASVGRRAALEAPLDDQGFATLLETTPGGRRVNGIRTDTADLALCELLARRLAREEGLLVQVSNDLYDTPEALERARDEHRRTAPMRRDTPSPTVGQCTIEM